jgi:hypothetical protein
MRKVTPETALKRAAKDFLVTYRIWTFPLTAGMGAHPGAPDRIGIHQGKPLAIEFKAPKGYLSAFQKVFRDEWRAQGGIYIECRTIEGLAAGLGIKTLLT